MRNIKRSLLIPLIITLLISLLFGIGLGLKLQHDRAARLGVVTSSRSLKILALAGAIPAAVLKGFRSSENIAVELVEEPTPQALAKRFQSEPNLDLVTLLSFQIPEAVRELRIQTLRMTDIVGFRSVSRDFVDLPGEKASVVPFFWGVIQLEEGGPKPEILLNSLKLNSVRNNEGALNTPEIENGTALLWILNFAMATKSNRTAEVNSFIGYMLRPQVAIEIATLTGQASTNSGLDSSALASQLKPSYLRQIPLTKLVLLNH